MVIYKVEGPKESEAHWISPHVVGQYHLGYSDAQYPLVTVWTDRSALLIHLPDYLVSGELAGFGGLMR